MKTVENDIFTISRCVVGHNALLENNGIEYGICFEHWRLNKKGQYINKHYHSEFRGDKYFEKYNIRSFCNILKDSVKFNGVYYVSEDQADTIHSLLEYNCTMSNIDLPPTFIKLDCDGRCSSITQDGLKTFYKQVY